MGSKASRIMAVLHQAVFSFLCNLNTGALLELWKRNSWKGWCSDLKTRLSSAEVPSHPFWGLQLEGLLSIELVLRLWSARYSYFLPAMYILHHTTYHTFFGNRPLLSTMQRRHADNERECHKVKPQKLFFANMNKCLL